MLRDLAEAGCSAAWLDLIHSAVQALQAKDGTIKKHRPKGSGLQAADLICAAERSESLIQTEMAMKVVAADP